MKLNKCRIILTGASSGIGWELLQQLQQYDVHILAVDLNIEGIKGDGVSLFPYRCDISNSVNLDKLFDDAECIIGGVDIFIANAGFAYYEKIDQPDWEHIERIYQTNVFSPLYCLEKLQELHPDGNFKMVITASAMGKLSMPGYALYSSTKAALDAFADGFRFETDCPHQLCLVYPIATSTKFFQNAGNNIPVPWPVQDPAQVARAIIGGIEKDYLSVYPSQLFKIMMYLNRYLSFIFPLYLRSQHRKFKSYIKQSAGL